MNMTDLLDACTVNDNTFLKSYDSVIACYKTLLFTGMVNVIVSKSCEPVSCGADYGRSVPLN
jgi:hypothetical protein